MGQIDRTVGAVNHVLERLAQILGEMEKNNERRHRELVEAIENHGYKINWSGGNGAESGKTVAVAVPIELVHELTKGEVP